MLLKFGFLIIFWFLLLWWIRIYFGHNFLAPSHLPHLGFISETNLNFFFYFSWRISHLAPGSWPNKFRFFGHKSDFFIVPEGFCTWLLDPDLLHLDFLGFFWSWRISHLTPWFQPKKLGFFGTQIQYLVLVFKDFPPDFLILTFLISIFFVDFFLAPGAFPNQLLGPDLFNSDFFGHKSDFSLLSDHFPSDSLIPTL